jgi:hypothetical protein
LAIGIAAALATGAMKTLLVLAALACSTAYAEPPKLMIGTDPLGPLNDVYALTAAYALSDHVALRGEVQMQRDDFDTNELWHYRISVPMFLDRTFHGPFIEPGLVQMQGTINGYVLDASGNPVPQAVQLKTFGPSMMVGYEWTFHDRYTIAAAFGGSKIWSSTPGVLGLGGPEYYVRVGWLF